MIFDPVPFAKLDGAVALAMLYQGVITAAIGMVLWMNLLARYGAVALHSFVFLMPISGVLCGSLVLGEPVTPHILRGLVLITLGIVIVSVRLRRPHGGPVEDFDDQTVPP